MSRGAMSDYRRALVSIGLPVFNGSNYIEVAIESILGQTLTDFELIISDNASTDDTEEICRRYAAQDARIRYHRNVSNIGASANFNRCFELASAKYFKWAAHDDVIEPTYLERCVAALESNPDAVLCQSLVRLIDADGNSVGIYDSELRGADSASTSRRFAALVISTHWCTETFGLIRAEALAKTRLIGHYFASDRALCAELALLGRCLQVPEPLFSNRDHPDRCVRAAYPDRRSVRYWYLPGAARPSLAELCPMWLLYAEYWRMVRRHVPERRERIRCYGHLLRWLVVYWNALRLLLEPVSAVDPRILAFAADIKHRLFGAARVALVSDSGRRLRHR
jgi:glycosyltransferase involved in cell wall biosynthesis